MKINPIMNTNIQRNFQASRAAPSKSTPPAGLDEVTFSEESLNFSKLISEVEYRTQGERAHIANIANAVRQGEYRIPSDKIAEKILESVIGR